MCGTLFSLVTPNDAFAKTKFVQTSIKQTSKSLLENPEKQRTLDNLLQSIPSRQSLPTPVSIEESRPTASADSTEVAETETISLQLRLSEKRVYVYKGDIIKTSYPVAIGRAGWETPTGKFEVFHQVIDPGWTNPITSEVMAPGPNNPLGDRWIAFWTDGTNSIGFHGTPNRESVGTAASHGCVRMYNEDVRQLYEMVEVGTVVTVVP